MKFFEKFQSWRRCNENLNFFLNDKNHDISNLPIAFKDLAPGEVRECNELLSEFIRISNEFKQQIVHEPGANVSGKRADMAKHLSKILPIINDSRRDKGDRVMKAVSLIEEIIARVE